MPTYSKSWQVSFHAIALGQDHIYDLHGATYDILFDPGAYRQRDLIERNGSWLLILDAATGTPTATDSLAALLPTATPYLTQTAVVVVVTNTPVALSPPTATYTAPPPLPQITAIRPRDAAIARDLPGIWDGLAFDNLEAPGMTTYYCTISATEQRWAFSWCGQDAAHFQQILAPFTITFAIDGRAIPADALLHYDSQGVCRVWSTILSGWRSGDQVTLDITYHLSAPIQGSEGLRPAGDYTHRIVVSVW